MGKEINIKVTKERDLVIDGKAMVEMEFEMDEHTEKLLSEAAEKRGQDIGQFIRSALEWFVEEHGKDVNEV